MDEHRPHDGFHLWAKLETTAGLQDRFNAGRQLRRQLRAAAAAHAADPSRRVPCGERAGTGPDQPPAVLRRQLARKGLSVTGGAPELVNRLAAALHVDAGVSDDRWKLEVVCLRRHRRLRLRLAARIATAAGARHTRGAGRQIIGRRV